MGTVRDLKVINGLRGTNPPHMQNVGEQNGTIRCQSWYIGSPNIQPMPYDQLFGPRFDRSYRQNTAQRNCLGDRLSS